MPRTVKSCGKNFSSFVLPAVRYIFWTRSAESKASRSPTLTPSLSANSLPTSNPLSCTSKLPRMMLVGSTLTFPRLAGSIPTNCGASSLAWIVVSGGGSVSATTGPLTKGDTPVTSGLAAICFITELNCATDECGSVNTLTWALKPRMRSRHSWSKPLITAMTIIRTATPSKTPMTEITVITETNVRRGRK